MKNYRVTKTTANEATTIIRDIPENMLTRHFYSEKKQSCNFFNNDQNIEVI
jgi:hypothetical protein